MGKYDHSKKECAPDAVNGNASTGMQMCSRERKIPTLKPPQILNGNENLDSLASQVETVSSREVSVIASSTQILSSMPD
ncbi:hypothetical protein Nmel_003190 [Mimus melanotis]